MNRTVSKRIFSLLTTVALFSTIVAPALAFEEEPHLASASVYMSATGKQAFAKAKQLEYARANSMQTNSTIGQQENIDSLILQAACASDRDEIDAITAELESLGVYRYKEGASTPTTRSSSTDVNIDAPDIYYNVSENTWTVATGGYWRTDAWMLDHPDIGNVGTPDAFGVGYTSISGTYNSYAVRQTASISNGVSGAGYDGILTSNRADGNAELGFGFRLQDEVRRNDDTGEKYFLGTKWAGACTYDSTFADYNGVATSYYAHTWNSCTIEVEFGISANPSLNVSVSNSKEGFRLYSTDTRF